MQDVNWIHNPVFQNLHPKKLEVMEQLLQNTSGKPIAQSIPYLMQANRQLQREGLTFSENESSMIMEILTKDMSAAEKKQLEQIKTLIQSRAGKQEKNPSP